jgi:hypothetical protein
MEFKDLNLTTEYIEAGVKLNDSIELGVRTYLPIDEKGKLITFVASNAVDATTGCFSPLRIEVYFSIAVMKWYAGVEFTEDDFAHIGEVYDALEINGIIGTVMSAIPEEELTFMQDLVNETMEDIAKYNTSLAGMVSSMSQDASALNTQIDSILESIKNKEGLETLSVIKDVVGTD